MGLDMYLYRKNYVKNWDHIPKDQRHEVLVTKNGVMRADINPTRVAYVIEEVAYWRKANCIHRWFIERSGGRPDDSDHYVDRDQLAELVETCKKVLGGVELVDGQIHVGTTWSSDEGKVEKYEPGQVVAQPAIVEKLLPTQSGFFFGSTDYDEYYLEDLKETIRQIEPLLAIENDTAEYEYHASW